MRGIRFIVLLAITGLGLVTADAAQAQGDEKRRAQNVELQVKYDQVIAQLDAEYERRSDELRAQTAAAKQKLYEDKPSVFDRGKDEANLNRQHGDGMSALVQDINGRKSTVNQYRNLAKRELIDSGTISLDTWKLISPNPGPNPLLAGSTSARANEVSVGPTPQMAGATAATQTLPPGQAPRPPSNQNQSPGASDLDGDGYASIADGGTDCDDRDPNRYPGNTEVGDPSHDEDGDPSTPGVDRDKDGFVNMAHCNGRICGQDCDDSKVAINPGAQEICDGIDNNCDGTTDDVGSSLWYPDNDHDLFGDSNGGMFACQNTKPTGYVDNNYDCDDNASGINPGNDNCPRSSQ